MNKRFCDFCGDEISDADLMPGGGRNLESGLGMEVKTPVPGKFTVTVAIGPIGVNGAYNAHHFHKTCVLRIIAAGVPS